MAFIIFLYALVSIFRGTIAFYDLLEFFKGSRLKCIFGAATLSGTSVGRSLVVEGEEDNPKLHSLRWEGELIRLSSGLSSSARVLYRLKKSTMSFGYVMMGGEQTFYWSSSSSVSWIFHFLSLHIRCSSLYALYNVMMRKREINIFYLFKKWVIEFEGKLRTFFVAFLLDTIIAWKSLKYVQISSRVSSKFPFNIPTISRFTLWALTVIKAQFMNGPYEIGDD